MPNVCLSMSNLFVLIAPQRCRESGIETSLTPTIIPDSWWQNKRVAFALKEHGYSRQTSDDEETPDEVAADGASSRRGSVFDSEDSWPLPVVIPAEPPSVEPVSTIDAPSAGIETSTSELPSPQVSPLRDDTAPKPGPLLDVQKNVVGSGAGAGQTGPSSPEAARQRRRGGVRNFLKGLACWP